jgi:crossover junction endodeoxyribonuclease RusA
VKQAALDAMSERIWVPLTGPCQIDIQFVLGRPKSHYRTGQYAEEVRVAAPYHPAVKPDLDKLVRSTLDALTDVQAFTDDALIVSLHAVKRYPMAGEGPGALIRVEQAP